MKCKMCDGKGVVLQDLNDFRFGAGFRAFMSAGCFQRQSDDGHTLHEMVCPRCDGARVVIEEPKGAA